MGTLTKKEIGSMTDENLIVAFENWIGINETKQLFKNELLDRLKKGRMLIAAHGKETQSKAMIARLCVECGKSGRKKMTDIDTSSRVDIDTWEQALK